MNWKDLKTRFTPPPRTATAPFTMPEVALEVQPEFVVGARLEGSGAALWRVERVGVSPLPAASLAPALEQANVLNETELHQAVSAVTEKIGNGSGQSGLILPDAAVRVSFLSFESLPPEKREAEALVRWKLKESLPFPPEQARISYHVVSRDTTSVEVVALCANRSVVGQYESVLEGVVGGVVLVLPATMLLLGLLPDAPAGGQLLISSCCGWVTAAVVEGGRLRFWRTRPIHAATAEEQSRSIATETARALASSRDHLQVDIRNVWLSARPEGAAELAAGIAPWVSESIAVLAPEADLAAGLAAGEDQLLSSFGAPIAGLAMHSRLPS